MNKKNIFREFFEDSGGRLSSMRLFSFISLLNALIISWLGFYSKHTPADIITQEIPWLVGAFVPKAIQKFAETKEMIGTTKKEKTDEQPNN